MIVNAKKYIGGLMKRLTSILLTLLLITSLAGCSGDETVKELSLYIQYDIVELSEIENDLTEAYNGITKSNNINMSDAYQELVTTATNLAVKLNDKAVMISYSIKSPELTKTHNIYVEYTKLLLDATDLIASGLATNNINLIDEGIEKATKAAELGDEFRKSLIDLGNKYNIKIDFED